MSDTGRIDFGYSWAWTYGHLIPAGVFLAGAGTAAALSFPLWGVLTLTGIGLWFVLGFCIARFGIRMNAPTELPVKEFMAGKSGRILDIGCGAGRASIMVGQARPGAKITSLDNFSANYIRGHGKENTLRNMEAAGIADRVTVEEGDMRNLSFEDKSFDGAVSSFAIDHLDEAGIRSTLSEVHRVLEDEGEFLLMVIVPNIWFFVAYGFLMHASFPDRVFWRKTLRNAGFTQKSEGSVAGCAWFLVRKSSAPVAAPAPAIVEESGQRKGGHSFSLRGMVIPTAATGLAMFAGAVTLRALGWDVSWWWIAASIPIGLHVGPILMLAAGALRWLTRRSA